MHNHIHSVKQIDYIIHKYFMIMFINNISCDFFYKFLTLLCLIWKNVDKNLYSKFILLIYCKWKKKNIQVTKY